MKQFIKAAIPPETCFRTKDKDKEVRTIYEPDQDCAKRSNWSVNMDGSDARVLCFCITYITSEFLYII
jgi:hypothetical protein